MEDEHRPEPMAGKEARPIWRLSNDERRLFWITFVAGVASIVVSAAIIGGALAWARWDVRDNGGAATFGWITLACVGLTALLLFGYSRIRRDLREAGQAPPLTLRISQVALLLLDASFALAWIGIAAGVK